MKLSTKKRIKLWLALVTFFGSGWFFLWIGAGPYSLGLAGMCVALSYVALWPEAHWMLDEVKGRRRLYVFLGMLIVPSALLFFGWLMQTQSDKHSSSAAVSTTER